MKKLIAFLVALVMLVLPMAGMAEGADKSFIDEAVENGRAVERVTTFVAANDLTGVEMIDQIIGELMAAVRVTTYKQENDGTQAGLRVTMTDKDILTVDIASKDDATYLHSDLIADTTIMARADESETIMDKMISLMERKGLIDAEQAESMRAQMEEAKSGAEAAANSVDMDALIKGFEQDEESIQELLDLFVDMAERVTEADPATQPENSDPATQALEIRLTAEDLVVFYEKIFDMLKANEEYMKLLDSVIESADADISGAEIFDAALEVLRTELPEKLEDDVVVTIYLNGEDEPVAATGEFAFKELEDAQRAEVKMLYTRLTAEDVATHNVHYEILLVGTDGEAQDAVADISFAMREDGLDAAFTVNSDETTISIGLTASQEKSETERKANATVTLAATAPDTNFNGQLDLTIEDKKNGEDAEQVVVVKLSQDGKLKFTIITESKTVDPYASIATEDVLHLAEMTDDELDAWFDDVVANMQVWMISVFQALPPSVLMLIMGSVE